MMDAVHRFEGTVNQVLGDGIMALFGAPIAHEDHALHACYATLAMQTTLRRYAEEVRRTQGLEAQLLGGLNSGDVVVRTIGNDLHMDYSAVGQTTHLAACMEQLATPGTIRMPVATLRLIEGLVRVTALGPMPVKDVPKPVEVFELLGTTPVRRRLQAAVARGLTHFVGRDQALAQAARGRGRLVALLGDAGVGKSREVVGHRRNAEIRRSLTIRRQCRIYVCELLHIKSFYGVWSGNAPECSLRLSIGKYRLYCSGTLSCAWKDFMLRRLTASGHT